MKNKKLLVLGSMFFALCLTACGENKSVEPEPEPDNTVDVFVLSGQSNMEGSTIFDGGTGKEWLQKACDRLEIDSTPMFNGFDNVYTSYYGYYPYGGSVHASNKSKPMDGLFLNTKVGMGNTDRYMGPEIGIAHVLQERATEDRPVYLIKCAFSGSGFAANDPNWILDGDPRTDRKYSASQNLYENKLKLFVENNLELIKDTGKDPVIKGFLWHQGESDANQQDQATNYKYSMKALIQRFRDDFAEYAPDQDGENISFVDGYVYDGPQTPYAAVDKLNTVKKEIAEEGENNFIINMSYKQTYGYSTEEDGGPMKLEIGNVQGQDVEGGYDKYHYKTYDDVKMGIAYGRCIVDNVLD